MVATIHNKKVSLREEEVRFMGENEEAHATSVFAFQLFEDVVLAVAKSTTKYTDHG